MLPRAIYEALGRGIPLALLLMASPADGQPAWSLRIDGQVEAWPAEAALPADSASAARIALSILHGRGYFGAAIDSVALGTVFGRVGPILTVETVTVSGLPDARRALGEEVARDLQGRPLDSRRLQESAMRILEAMESDGRPGASVRVDRLASDSSGSGLDLALSLDPGSPVALQGIVVHGTSRTDPRLVELVTGLEPGRRLQRFDAAAMARALEESGLFARVVPPVLLATGDSTAIVQFVIEDGPPGAFDAALGYQPGTGGRAGTLVGSGRLALVNPFGGGRRFDVLIDRLPGQVSRAELSASDPFFLSWPVELAVSFRGLQQDSTFGRQAWGLEAAVRLTRSVALTVSGSRETARPGTAGTALVGGRQVAPQSDGLFAGVGVRVRTLNHGLNPTRGLLLEMRVERGSTARRQDVVTATGDTTRISTRSRTERLTAAGRVFVPLTVRWVVVTGLDAALLVSDTYDRADLFRLGGARSLRGYDEDRFEGRAAGRALVEIRRLLDLRSQAFAFVDLGFVDVPDGPGREPGFRFRPGFGLGLQLDTPAGLVTATYGFNPEDGPTSGRVHLAYSFGL